MLLSLVITMIVVVIFRMVRVLRLVITSCSKILLLWWWRWVTDMFGLYEYFSASMVQWVSCNKRKMFTGLHCYDIHNIIRMTNEYNELLMMTTNNYLMCIVLCSMIDVVRISLFNSVFATLTQIWRCWVRLVKKELLVKLGCLFSDDTS